MALQHKLRIARSRIPKLHASILASRQDPISVRRKSDGENKVLVTFEGLDAASTFGGVVGVSTARSDEFPHFDCFVEGAGDQVLAVGCEGYRIDGILVTVWAFQSLDEISGNSIPDSNGLVKRASCYVLGIRRNGDGGDAVLDGEG